MNFKKAFLFPYLNILKNKKNNFFLKNNKFWKKI